jgi:tetratricopeptide (TPR) repeat protein
MSRFLRSMVLLFCGMLLLPVACAWAENEGQEDLDRATDAKLTANTMADLDEVARLLESALQKGLDEGNTQFANNLLSSTLVQRATVRVALLAKVSPRDPKAAEIHKTTLDDLKKAVQLNPKQAQALLLIAQLERTAGGDAKRADEALAQAVELSANDPDLKAKALTLRATLEENLEKRLADLNEAIHVAPHYVEAVRARGVLLGAMGKLEESLADFNKAIELDPKHIATFHVKALVLTQMKRYNDALAALEEAQKLNPDMVDPLLDKARIHVMQADLAAAIHELDQAHRIDPESVDVLLLRAGLESDLAKRGEILDEAVRAAPRKSAAWRVRGLWRADQNKLDEALADCDKAIELQPTEAANYDAKLVVLARLKKYDEALSVVEKMRELEPKSIYPLMQQARLRIQQENLDEAIHSLDAAEQIEPSNTSVLQLRATVYQELASRQKAADGGKKPADAKKPADDNEKVKAYRDKALADIGKALELEPKSTSALRLRAVLLADAGKTDEAIGELEKIRQAEPKDILTLLQLAMLYALAQKNDQAIECYSAALLVEPNQWMAYRGRGDLLLNQGKHAAAIADYEKALKLQPTDSGILNNFAWVLATSPEEKLRDGRRAVVLATQACEATGHKVAHILSTLGAAYAETGDFQTAIQWATQGIALGNDEEKESLSKEVETYRTGKPVRELLIDGKPAKTDAEKEPPKPDASTENAPKPEPPKADASTKTDDREKRADSNTEKPAAKKLAPKKNRPNRN